MVSIQKKKIKGKVYFYLVKSIRLPNGKIKTINKILSKKEKKLSSNVLEKKCKNYFLDKEKILSTKLMQKNIKVSYIFSEEDIAKLEDIRVSYKYFLKNLTKNQIKDIFDRFAVNFTYDSNAIEGNSLTLRDVAIVIFDKENIESKSLREIYETRNCRVAVDMMLGGKFSIKIKDIIKIHKIIMRDIDVRAGFKKLPNVIYWPEKTVATTPPELVEREMNELIKWYENQLKRHVHPLELAALFHGKFEEIHPFEDGNGIVGRILINVILINNGYPPLIIRKTFRKAYMSALLAFNYKHADKLTRFMLKKFKDTYKKFFEVYVRYV